MIDDAAIAEFAATNATSVAAVQRLIASAQEQVGAVDFYIFWTSSGARGAASEGGRSRTLLAFTTPDAALAFAQRNQLGSSSAQPRLRRLTLLHLFQAMLQEPLIVALVITTETAEQPIRAGQLPPGMRIERAELVRRLRETGEARRRRAHERRELVVVAPAERVGPIGLHVGEVGERAR